jgi:hypothetical protein
MFEDDNTSIYTQNSNQGMNRLSDKTSQNKARKFKLPRTIKNLVQGKNIASQGSVQLSVGGSQLEDQQELS